MPAKKKRGGRFRRGRGEGTIYQRDDGRWCAQLDLGKDAAGKRIRRAVLGSTQTDVYRKAQQLRDEAAKEAARPDWSVKQAIEW
jgi:hypothetical protein